MSLAGPLESGLLLDPCGAWFSGGIADGVRGASAVTAVFADCVEAADSSPDESTEETPPSVLAEYEASEPEAIEPSCVCSGTGVLAGVDSVVDDESLPSL